MMGPFLEAGADFQGIASLGCVSCRFWDGLLAACLLALPPFEGFGFVDPFDDGGVQAGEDVADFGGRARKNSWRMLTRLSRRSASWCCRWVSQADGVVAEYHGVHVVAERDGRIAEFADSVHRVESARHADLENVLAERATCLLSTFRLPAWAWRPYPRTGRTDRRYSDPPFGQASMTIVWMRSSSRPRP